MTKSKSKENYSVVLVNGSPHKGGNTVRNLKVVESELRSNGISTRWIHIGNKPIQGCIGCEHCQTDNRCVFGDDCCNTIISEIINSDGVIFGSPVYFAGPSGSLCSVMDRVFYAAGDKGQHFAGKPVASVVSCWRAGSTSALQRLNQYYTEGGMIVVSSKYWNMTFESLDDFGEEILKDLGKRFSDVVKIMHATRC